MIPAAPGRRPAGGLLVAVLVLAAVATWPGPGATPDPRPNVIVVLTDDQRWDSLEAMPWLSGELGRAGSGWASFPLAVANSPLCCPARAALLTGRLPRHTGVLRNEDGGQLDESQTIATWLRDAGYLTGIVGKYLNRYPFGRLPYVPPGWDRAVIKPNEGDVTVYRDFDIVDQGSPVHVTGGYSTDWLAARAVSFVRAAPVERPFFLLFAPSAPHPPWVPAERYVGTAAGRLFQEAPTVAGALSGAPPWVEALPIPSAAQRAIWVDERRRAFETLAAVDDALRAIVVALGDRLDDTVIVVLSDQGYSFGEHRWAGKRCPYDACVRIPLVVHVPGGSIEPGNGPVSTVDVAPTLLELAGTAPVPGADGTSFAPRLRGADPSSSEAVFMEWAGDEDVPGWEAVRTRSLKLIRYADGTEELYDLGGVHGPPDPFEAKNRVADPPYAGLLVELRLLLGRHPGRR